MRGATGEMNRPPHRLRFSVGTFEVPLKSRSVPRLRNLFGHVDQIGHIVHEVGGEHVLGPGVQAVRAMIAEDRNLIALRKPENVVAVLGRLKGFPRRDEKFRIPDDRRRIRLGDVLLELAGRAGFDSEISLEVRFARLLLGQTG